MSNEITFNEDLHKCRCAGGGSVCISRGHRSYRTDAADHSTYAKCPYHGYRGNVGFGEKAIILTVNGRKFWIKADKVEEAKKEAAFLRNQGHVVTLKNAVKENPFA